MAEACTAVLFTRVIAMAERNNFTQGSVATGLRCGGIFNYFVVRHLLLSLKVKEF